MLCDCLIWSDCHTEPIENPEQKSYDSSPPQNKEENMWLQTQTFKQNNCFTANQHLHVLFHFLNK
jgi:hypothetical protein